jgi:hypothetical protein
LSKSISGGFAQYGSKAEGNVGQVKGMGMGFINVNKIVNREFYKKG